MIEWCLNRLLVSGPEQEVRRFIEENKGEETIDYVVPILFSKSVPEPPESKDWSDPEICLWRIENWGVKWNPNFKGLAGARKDSIKIEKKSSEEKEPATTTYIFNTADCSASFWLDKVAFKYPLLSFCLTYGQAVSDFGGSIVYLKGKLADESKGAAAEYLADEDLQDDKRNAFF